MSYELKKILNIRAEINDKEKTDVIERINEAKIWLRKLIKLTGKSDFFKRPK